MKEKEERGIHNEAEEERGGVEDIRGIHSFLRSFETRRTLGATSMAARLLACLLAGLAGWLAGSFDSRLLEKPDSSCAKLCFPSCVYVPTHALGWNNVGYFVACVYVRGSRAGLFVALDFDLRSAQILALSAMICALF